jgi:hypothetical protein
VPAGGEKGRDSFRAIGISDHHPESASDRTYGYYTIRDEYRSDPGTPPVRFIHLIRNERAIRAAPAIDDPEIDPPE